MLVLGDGIYGRDAASGLRETGRAGRARRRACGSAPPGAAARRRGRSVNHSPTPDFDLVGQRGVPGRATARAPARLGDIEITGPSPADRRRHGTTGSLTTVGCSRRCCARRARSAAAGNVGDAPSAGGRAARRGVCSGVCRSRSRTIESSAARGGAVNCDRLSTGTAIWPGTSGTGAHLETGAGRRAILTPTASTRSRRPSARVLPSPRARGGARRVMDGDAVCLKHAAPPLRIPLEGMPRPSGPLRENCSTRCSPWWRSAPSRARRSRPSLFGQPHRTELSGRERRVAWGNDRSDQPARHCPRYFETPGALDRGRRGKGPRLCGARARPRSRSVRGRS